MAEKPFKKVLIVNRGEIAVRIIRALRDLGIQSIGIYSDADHLSLHRKLADYAVRLPGSSSAETYLNIPVILDVLEKVGADAVHPGYGFLAENFEFAAKLEERGVKLIGPTSKAMQQMGDKVAARHIMQNAKVPVVPGSDGPLSSVSELKQIVRNVGFPMILKAAAGGGGRGMRVVRSDADLEEAFLACQREAQSYFGNSSVFCERYIEGGRHIEVQVLFDHYGNGVHLFERDCSIQRRHQKLIEEAPSIFLNDERRRELGAIAVRAGEAVGYRGVGTVEFICESPERCYFMEMNTRIQVEHPVTEMITGVDLIVEQIKAAQGQKLELKQDDIKIEGHALEVRINAEDATKDFMPAPGYVKHLRLPSGPFVRVDSHLYPGYEIPEFYDSMIAKFITWGQDRDDAFRKMRRALAEFEIEGIPTTSVFHEAVLAHADFQKGAFTTAFLDEKLSELKASMNQEKETDLRAAAVLAAVLAQTSKPTIPLEQSSDLRQRWIEHARRELED